MFYIAIGLMCLLLATAAFCVKSADMIEKAQWTPSAPAHMRTQLDVVRAYRKLDPLSDMDWGRFQAWYTVCKEVLHRHRPLAFGDVNKSDIPKEKRKDWDILILGAGFAVSERGAPLVLGCMESRGSGLPWEIFNPSVSS